MEKANGKNNHKMSTNHIIYIIVEDKRKWILTIKVVLINRITAYLKFRHVSL